MGRMRSRCRVKSITIILIKYYSRNKRLRGNRMILGKIDGNNIEIKQNIKYGSGFKYF